MPIQPNFPGVYINETSSITQTIAPVPTSLCAFLGRTAAGPLNVPTAIFTFQDFQQTFGGLTANTPLSYAVNDFFANGGGQAIICRVSSSGATLTPADYLGDLAARTGLYQLEHADLFNILCIPPDTVAGDTDLSVYAAAAAYCAQRRAMLIVDPPAKWTTQMRSGTMPSPADLDITGDIARNAVVYFPRVVQPDPLNQESPTVRVPCGLVAGVWAASDLARGVWKAPAGTNARLAGIAGLELNLTDAQNELLNPLGINCLRSLPAIGTVVWGARTLRGADTLSDDYKYLNVRRFLLFLEESFYRGTRWAVFEPNDEALWSALRLSISTFLQGPYQQGALAGSTPAMSYFVKCDATTTTQADVDRGVVNIVIGVAVLKPAEFVVIQIQQSAGQTTA